jgi:hypothetical protein
MRKKRKRTQKKKAQTAVAGIAFSSCIEISLPVL